MQRSVRFGFGTAGALAAALILGEGPAFATDQLVTGKNLLIKNLSSGNKLVFLSKDPTISFGAGGTGESPVCGAIGGGGGRLHVSGTPGGDFVINLHCSGWSSVPGMYKYKDLTQATCTVVQAKDNTKVKAVCKGTQVDYALGAAQSDVAVTLSTGSNGSPGAAWRYCAQFGSATSAHVVKDGSDGKTYLARNSNAPASCVASPSGAFLD